MQYFAALFWNIWLPPARWMFYKSIAIRQDTFNTNKLPNPYFASLGTRLCRYGKWKERVEWAQCVKVMTTGSAVQGRQCTSAGFGIAYAWEAALHNHKARRCHKLCHGRKMKSFADIGRCAGHRPRRCTGKCPRRSHSHFHAMWAPCTVTCKLRGKGWPCLQLSKKG